MRMYRTMFENYNDDYATVQCQALAKYFKHKADFVFCHRHKHLYDLPQIKDVIDFDFARVVMVKHVEEGCPVVEVFLGGQMNCNHG